jgi:hypothetical protein
VLFRWRACSPSGTYSSDRWTMPLDMMVILLCVFCIAWACSGLPPSLLLCTTWGACLPTESTLGWPFSIVVLCSLLGCERSRKGPFFSPFKFFLLFLVPVESQALSVGIPLSFALPEVKGRVWHSDTRRTPLSVALPQGQGTTGREGKVSGIIPQTGTQTPANVEALS